MAIHNHRVSQGTEVLLNADFALVRLTGYPHAGSDAVAKAPRQAAPYLPGVGLLASQLITSLPYSSACLRVSEEPAPSGPVGQGSSLS